MNTDFSINVHVDLGVTPELRQLVGGILGHVVTEAAAPAIEETPKADTPAPKAEASEPARELTEEDIRSAMHKTRQRIEGEDYKEHTDSDLYQKYHKALTVQFKQLALTLGADKPSALPVDKRADFIKLCDELQICSDGTIGSEVPF